jgi:hypothetical protein
VELVFTDDMALNAWGAPWPLTEASSAQSGYPASLAVDGNDDTFWVSGGLNAGEGPTPDDPETLTIDFGVETTIGSVVMVPRSGYGPTAYDILSSLDGATWQTVREEPSVPNGTKTTTFPPTTARYLQLSMTGSWDWVVPSRNVQVRSLRVYPPSDDLALNPWGAPWPQAFASSSQSGYPATNAFDGDDGTFWVSGGSVSGEGPMPDQPEMLGVDFGSPTLIGSITVVPRSGYGPTNYTVELSDDGDTWVEVASVSAPNATSSVEFPAVETQLVRLRITGSYDWQQPPRNVQIRSMIVEAP